MTKWAESAPSASMQSLFEAQRRAFALEANPTLDVRVDRLARLLSMTEQNEEAIVAAISADFGHRSRHETVMAEIFTVVAAIGQARRQLRRWMKPRRVSTPLYLLPGYSRLHYQPLGVVGIISPWNYPFQLVISPAVGAIAAGNRVMLKPSEFTPRLSGLLATMVAQFFSPEELAVVTGDAEAGRAFASLPFDHLLFTGSTAVGREIAIAAASNLTPVTLELGGKSPVIVDEDCDLAAAARSIALGKMLNAGQTCIAPDYVLVAASRLETLVLAIAKAVSDLYPALAANPDYSSIASSRHFDRLRSIVDDAKAKGAQVMEINPASEALGAEVRKFPLVLLLQVSDDMRAMHEEIFGPVLPVKTYSTLDEAIAYVNGRPRPLALYWFGTNSARRDQVLAQTISGGVTVNDTLWHFCQDNLPFGGVGASGIGAYHGEHGFRTFTKEKAVFYQRRLNGTRLLHPPYGPRFEAVMRWLRKLV
jgi:coniferyl-aldehyde dehydrogenase